MGGFNLKLGKQFPDYKKLLRIMYVSFFCFLLGTNIVWGELTYAQRTLLKVSLKNVELEEVFNSIRQQSEFEFFYNNDQVDTSIKVNVDLTNVDINEVLQRVLPAVYEYEINDRYVLISKTKEQSSITVPEPQQQGRTITGVIRDASGPVIGANVIVRGTTNGDVTNIDGQFTISNVQSNAVLQISFIGYISQEVNVGNRTQFDITIQEDVGALEEVVVVGYGTMSRRDLTGSIASVGSEQIRNKAITRVDQILAGNVPGTQVKMSTGQPGAAPQVRIRGVGSITAGVDPLYVVDGVPVAEITGISPGDIATIDILKDASSTAIYGSRGANGVVMITTNRGEARKPQLKYEAFLEFQQVEKIPKTLNALQQANYTVDGFRNRNIDEGNDVSGHPTSWRLQAPPEAVDVLEGKLIAGKQPWEYVLHTAPQHQHRLSASGGSEDIRYAISGTFLNQEGIVLNSKFTRYSLNANIDAKLNRRLNMQLVLTPSYMDNNSTISYTGNYGGVIGGLIGIQPWIPLIDENGDYTYIGDIASMANVENPLARVENEINKQSRFFFMGKLNLKYNIMTGLDFNITLGGNVNNSRTDQFKPSLHAFFDNVANGSSTSNQNIDWMSEFTLNYNKKIGNHNIIGLAGYTMEKATRERNNLSSINYPNNLVSQLSAVAGQITNGTSTKAEYSLLSYFARVNYNYMSKYYITATMRADGSSRFGTNNKFGYFPSVSLRWRASQENFLQNIDQISDLSFRLSYGKSGNNNIGNYDHIGLISYVNYNFGDRVASGFAQGNIGNPSLSWEKQEQINAGIDIAIINSRIRLSTEYYVSKNYGLLLDVPIPTITGFSTALQNMGEVRNTGWEFSLNTANLSGKIFEWTTSFNLSTTKNEVLKLGPEGNPIYSGNNITQIGQPLGMFYGLISDGVFMNQAELDAGPSYNPGGVDRSRVGDRRFLDVNGDGEISTDDYTTMGSPYPDFYYGMTNNFSYKNISLSVSLYGSQGGQIYMYSRDGNNSGRGRVRTLTFNKNYWKSEAEPGDGWAPRPNDAPTGGNRLPGTHWLDNASFLRVNNITLSYDFPKSILQSVNINSLQIYLTARNPFLITKYTLWNPEDSTSSNPLQPGRENNDYPISKGLMFGLNIGF